MIKLELSLDEVNGILNLLGQQPFVQVQSLIVKIQTQASPQVIQPAEVEVAETVE